MQIIFQKVTSIREVRLNFKTDTEGISIQNCIRKILFGQTTTKIFTPQIAVKNIKCT